MCAEQRNLAAHPSPALPGDSSSAMAPALFAVQGLALYLGASLAVFLFAVIPAISVAWWRLAISALVLLAWRRPWGSRVHFSRLDLAKAALFGLFLATMNILFYLAIARIPIGPAVALEFAGPVVVAALSGRGWRDRLAIALAAAGVLAIGGLGLDWRLTEVLVGIALALGAGAAWASYILLGRALADRQDSAPAKAPSGMDSLAVAMAVGTLLYLPMAAPTLTRVLSSWQLLLGIIGVAVLSSVIPYVIDQVNFGRLSASTFAILTALLPATSVAVGAVVLGQLPNRYECLGLGLISVAVALTGRRRGSGSGKK